MRTKWLEAYCNVQQFTYGSSAKGFLWKVLRKSCGKFAEIHKNSDSFWCFQRGAFVRGGGISMIGVARTPFAIMNFASNPGEISEFI